MEVNVDKQEELRAQRERHTEFNKLDIKGIMISVVDMDDGCGANLYTTIRNMDDRTVVFAIADILHNIGKTKGAPSHEEIFTNVKCVLDKKMIDEAEERQS